ncbi:ornithine cyclodeaminase family protein [Amycolatopsis sp. cmx-11-12]|uniref:ornithine cyclodeaminase family protein n=1 Tax=Amycolatopsis sp. cmx-11-12 TaxID=2785795 RepID=UPI00391839AE
MKLLGLAELERVMDPHLVFSAVKAALIAHSRGRTVVPPPMHLDFPDADGDCHVKAGWVTGEDEFTVKIASGFYGNARNGIPANHGLMCVISARTGEVRAVLDDGGMLTAWRTAAAGALITHAMARPDARTVTVFGTGEQARLQVSWLARLRPIDLVLVRGRAAARAEELCSWFAAKGLRAEAGSGVDSGIVLTTTPSPTPLFDAGSIRPGTQVTGIGADMPHKNELPPELFARAATIVTDDHGQCLRHGDFGHAVRAGAVAENCAVTAGEVLSNSLPRAEDAITVADLTGVGVLDAALASAMVSLVLPDHAADGRGRAREHRIGG